jgi:hypothetical protein
MSTKKIQKQKLSQGHNNKKKIKRNANLSLFQDWKYKDARQKMVYVKKNDSNKTLFTKKLQKK